MKKLIVKQVRSQIGRVPGTKRTLQALGLGRIGKSRELPANVAVLGMIARLDHLLEVTDKSGAVKK